MQKKHLTKSDTFMIQTFHTLGLEGGFFSLTKGNYKNPQLTAHFW